MSDNIEHRAFFDLPVPGGIIDVHYGPSELFTKEFIKGVKKILAPITSKDIDDHSTDSLGYYTSEQITSAISKAGKAAQEAGMIVRSVLEECKEDDPETIKQVILERGRATGKTFELNTMKKNFPKDTPVTFGHNPKKS